MYTRGFRNLEVALISGKLSTSPFLCDRKYECGNEHAIKGIEIITGTALD